MLCCVMLCYINQSVIFAQDMWFKNWEVRKFDSIHTSIIMGTGRGNCRGPRGQVVSTLNSQPRGPEFNSSAKLVNIQLVCLPLVGVFNILYVQFDYFL